VTTSEDRLGTGSATPGWDAKSPGGRWIDPTAPKAPWYRRWWLLAVAVVVVVVVASVVSDLPRPNSVATKVAMTATVLKQVNTDIHPCAFAAAQSFSAYDQLKAGTFPSGDKSLVPTYLSDDQRACSFEDQSIYSISTITVPNIPAGPDLSALIHSVLQWTTADAIGAIIDIETLVKHPDDAKASRDLAKRERSLASIRALAERQRHAAATTLGTAPLPALGLPRLPDPTS
jgi:hypothetical protein